MPESKKDKGKKKGKSKKPDFTLHGYCPESISENFAACGKAIGIPTEELREQAAALLEMMQPSDTSPIPNKLTIDDLVLGPGGTRALVCALRGEGPGLGPLAEKSSRGHAKDKKTHEDDNASPAELPAFAQPPPHATVLTLPRVQPLSIDPSTGVLGPANYRLLTELELVDNRCMDSGAVELARLLTWEAVECCGIALEKLVIKCDLVGLPGAEALSAALSWRTCAPLKVSPLVSLSLNYITTFDDDCVRVLCHGLARNDTLKDLDLSFCGFGGEATPNLGRLIASPESKLASLCLKGNFLGPDGLKGLAYPGLELARSLETLDLTACGLGRPVYTKSRAHKDKVMTGLLDAWEFFVAALSTNLYGDAEPSSISTSPPSSPKLTPSRSGDMGNGALSQPAAAASPPASPTAAIDKETTAMSASGASSPTASPKVDAGAGAGVPLAAPGGAEGAAPDGTRTRLKRLILLENNLTPEQGEVLKQMGFPPKGPLQVLKIDITMPEELFRVLWFDHESGGGKKGKKKGKKGK